MGLFGKIFGEKKGAEDNSEPGHDLEGLARRLNMPLAALQAVPVVYREARIAKRDGSPRILQVPDEPLKKLQRTILRRLLGKLKVHPAATGFERGQSIATNAAPHVGAAVILKLDIQDFFATTTAAKVSDYFELLGWNRAAVKLLTALTTHKGGLPQGAPTSPRLSNLLNYHLDHRLFCAGLALGAKYTRYADDMTFSFAQADRGPVCLLLHLAQEIVEDEDYTLHRKKKLRIASQNDRMLVTGVVVNQKLNLPRTTRRRLRAVEHHLKTGKTATLSEQQLKGWRAYEAMIAAQRSPTTCE